MTTVISIYYHTVYYKVYNKSIAIENLLIIKQSKLLVNHDIN